jgi:hypothetical protein
MTARHVQMIRIAWAAGVPAKDVPMRSFIVRDPEGNLVQFFGE